MALELYRSPPKCSDYNRRYLYEQVRDLSLDPSTPPLIRPCRIPGVALHFYICLIYAVAYTVVNVGIIKGGIEPYGLYTSFRELRVTYPLHCFLGLTSTKSLIGTRT